MADDDGILRIGTEVDITALQSGMAKAQLKVRAAAADMSEAYKQFGAAARAGSEQAQRVLVEYQTSVNAARDQVREYAAAQREAQAAVRESARAQEEAAAAAHAEAAALEEAAAATQEYEVDTTKARFAAQLLGRELGVPIPRALSSIAAQSSLLGPLLELAFPVIAATAFTSIVGETVTKITDLYYAWDEVTQAEKRAQEQANGLINAFAKETERAQELTYKIIGDTQGKVAELQAKAADIQLKVRSDDNTAIAQARANLEDLQRRAKAIEIKPGAVGNEYQPTKDAQVAQAGIDNARTALDTAILKQKNDQKELIDLNHQAGEAAQQQAEKAARAAEEVSRRTAEAARKAAEEYGRGVEEMVRQDEEAVKGSQRVTDALTEAWTAAIRKDQEAAEIAARATKERTEEYKRNQQELQKLNEEQLKGSEIQDQVSASLQEAELHYELATGGVTRLGAAHQEAAIRAAEYKEKLDQLDAAIAQVQSNYELSPEQRAIQTQQLQNQRDQVAGQGQVAAIQDQTQIAQQASQPWVSAANQVSDAWIGAFNKILVGGRESWRAAALAGEQMTMALIGDAEKYLQKKIENYILEKVFHVQTEAAKVAATTSANATAATSTAAANVAMAESYAAVAAAAAAAATAAIPIVGPELAPAAAAATYADTSAYAALAAFDTGTSFVPRDGIAMIHQGETILPPPQADVLRDALSGGRGSQSGQPGGLQLHYSPTFTSHGTPSDARKTVKDLGRMLRQMNLTT